MKYRKEKEKTIEDVSCKEAATGSFYAGIFIGNFICQSGSGAVCSGGRDFQRIFFETIPGGRYSDGRVYLVFAAGPSFAVFSAAGICFYKIQKSGSYSVLDLDGLFCRTSVFYGSSRDGSKREHPVHCRNAPQFLCYIPAYLIVVWYAYCYPRMQWNIQKSLVSGGLL